ncbi:MAG: nitroreductase family protein [Acidimicrobiales bacterium]
MTTEISLLDALATTRSIRRYRPDPIPEADLNRMLWAATRAPQGSNRQGFRFLVLRDGPRAQAARRLIGDAAQSMWNAKRAIDRYDEGSGAAADTPKARMAATMAHFVDHVHEAPVIVVACLHLHHRPELSLGGAVYPAVQNLLLAARAMGYGGCITGFYRSVEPELRRVLAIPENPDEVAIAAVITLGRPAGRHGPVRRRPIAELVYEDGWGEAPAWAQDPPGARFTSAGPPRRTRGQEPFPGE